MGGQTRRGGAGDGRHEGKPEVAPYGAWRSPLTAARLAEGGVRLSWPQALGEALYWIEMRPLEGGRYALVRRGPDGSTGDVLPAGFDARTLVHEYGGGMYRAFERPGGGESVLVSRFDDQRLWRADLAAAPRRGRWAPRGRSLEHTPSGDTGVA
jgi:hypothetical protein